MCLLLTWSQVRFNLRMGGELRAATSAAMVEKLFKLRQHWYSMSVHYDFKRLEYTNLRRDDKMLDDRGTLPWIILHKDRIIHPISDLHITPVNT